MSESIRNLVQGFGDKREVIALQRLLEAARTDLEALRSENVTLLADLTATRAEVVKIVADITAIHSAVTGITAKLDADGGVTGTDYAATLDPAALTAVAPAALTTGTPAATTLLQ